MPGGIAVDSPSDRADGLSKKFRVATASSSRRLADDNGETAALDSREERWVSLRNLTWGHPHCRLERIAPEAVALLHQTAATSAGHH
jgi:hypothetical protein